MTTYKTPFSKRCEILGSLYLFYGENDLPDDTWKQYFATYDVGLPLSYFIWTGIATVKKGKESYIDDAWNDLCLLLNVDASAKYADLTDVIQNSPNSEDEE